MTNLDYYLSTHHTEQFTDVLFGFIDQSGKKDSEIYNQVEVSKSLFSKIRCKQNYVPTKKVVIRLGIALKLDTEDFNRLLNAAGYSLTNSKEDLVVSYFVENKIYDYMLINESMFDRLGTTLA